MADTGRCDAGPLRRRASDGVTNLFAGDGSATRPGDFTLTIANQPPVGACPVAAVLPGLEHIIALQNELRAKGNRSHQMVALCDLQRDMEAIAEAGQATSLAGAALQLMLGANAAADMGAELVSRRINCGGRDAAGRDRAAEATARSAYAVLAAHGGALAAVVVAEYFPADADAEPILRAA